MKIRLITYGVSIFTIGIITGCTPTQITGQCGTVPAIDRSVSVGAEYFQFEQTLSQNVINSSTPQQLNGMFEVDYCPANPNPPGWNITACFNCPSGVQPHPINRVEVQSCSINHTIPTGLVRPVTSASNGVYAYYSGCKLQELTDTNDGSTDQ